MTSALGRRRRLQPGQRVARVLTVAPRFLPWVGLVAITVALIAVITEGSPVTFGGLGERVLRCILFVLSCFVGAYAPVPGQPDQPSLFAVWALVLALTTSIGGLALTVLSVFARQLGVAIAVRRPDRVVVVGENARARAFAQRLRDEGRTVVTVGDDDTAMIRVIDRSQIAADRRVRRAVRGAPSVFVLQDSSVDGALIAAGIRDLPNTHRIHQMFDWHQDRLVFREQIRGGVLPRNEVFSPDEMVGTHIAHLIGHMVRMRRKRLGVLLRGTGPSLAILEERLTFVRSVLEFSGGIEFVDTLERADVVVLGVEQHEYVSAVDDVVGESRIVFTIAPERYFAAIGRDDLRAVSSAQWLAERNSRGEIAWANRVVLIDESRVGTDIAEIMLGVHGRWSRELHNAHSDFGSTGANGNPNRWLDAPPHPRLVTMANAAVDLMLRDLEAHGFELLVRDGDHDRLTPDEVETCARHIHEQYLTLTWRDEHNRVRRCAEHFVSPDGALVSAAPPPPWEKDTEQGRERNRAVVRDVYPAMAAVFGYRLTRRRAVSGVPS